MSKPTKCGDCAYAHPHPRPHDGHVLCRKSGCYVAPEAAPCPDGCDGQEPAP